MHVYLGMNFDYSDEGTIKVLMIMYVGKILKAFTEQIKEAISAISAIPVADHLFQIRDQAEAKFMPKEQAEVFHHTVVQLLFQLHVQSTS